MVEHAPYCNGGRPVLAQYVINPRHLRGMRRGRGHALQHLGHLRGHEN